MSRKDAAMDSRFSSRLAEAKETLSVSSLKEQMSCEKARLWEEKKEQMAALSAPEKVLKDLETARESERSERSKESLWESQREWRSGE